jgi:tetratricopeptide (TPR) repeat protein
MNQEALAVLQVRTRNDDAALQTVLEAIKDLDETSSRAALKYRASFHQMAAAALLFRCARGVSDYATWDPATCPDWSGAMEHQRMSKDFAEHLEGRERREAERARVNTDFLVARYKQEYNRALALLDTAAYLARENDNDWGLFQAESRRALIWSDKGDYARAFDIIRRIGRKLHSGEGSPFLPYMLTTQVRIAANAKDKRVAQRAMQELAALDGDVPDTLYKQASAAYASVFSNSTGNSSMPFWMLLSIAVGISVVLQFISTAARRHEHGVDLFNGRIPFLTALASPSTRDTSLLPRPTVDTAMPRNGTLLPHLPRTAADDDAAQDETDAPAARDAGADSQPQADSQPRRRMMRSIGIDLDDLPTIQPPEPTAPAPTTLGDLLKAQLKQDPAVPCYDGHGRKTGTISLSDRIINHAADDRFIAIRMEDRVVIAYRYARPQRLIVRQRPDGTMEKVELDQPVTAVPVAIIDTPA